MSNFVSVGFIDASMMTATLLTRHKALFEADTRRQEHLASPHHDTQSILLRGPKSPSAENWLEDVPQVDLPALSEWKTAKALLARIKNAVAPLNDNKPGILGKAMIVSLKPNGFVDWHVDEGSYAETHHRLHLCLVPSPGAWLYSGGEAFSPPVGLLTGVNNRVLHSALNTGPTARIHLIVDVRKP